MHPRKEGINHLFEIIERHGESLKDYIDIFDASTTVIENPNHRIALTTISKGFLDDPTIIDNPTYNGLVLNSYNWIIQMWVPYNWIPMSTSFKAKSSITFYVIVSFHARVDIIQMGKTKKEMENTSTESGIWDHHWRNPCRGHNPLEHLLA